MTYFSKQLLYRIISISELEKLTFKIVQFQLLFISCFPLKNNIIFSFMNMITFCS